MVSLFGGQAVRRGPVDPAVSSETLLSVVDVPGLCQIVLTVGLCPEVAVPLPAVWDQLFASSLVETLKMTGADVVRRIRAVRGGWSGPDVAGTSAVVDLGAVSDRAIECLAWDGGGRHDMVDDRPICELTSYELHILFSGGPATSGVVVYSWSPTHTRCRTFHAGGSDVVTLSNSFL